MGAAWIEELIRRCRACEAESVGLPVVVALCRHKIAALTALRNQINRGDNDAEDCPARP